MLAHLRARQVPCAVASSSQLTAVEQRLAAVDVRHHFAAVAAGSEVRVDKSLGFWYTNTLDPGNYMLRLNALDNQGKPQSACVIIVKVENAD